MNDARHQALHSIAAQHEHDCGQPGIFSSVTRSSGGTWTAVIDHYDTTEPLTPIGTPCRYTAANPWQVARLGDVSEREQ